MRFRASAQAVLPQAGSAGDERSVAMGDRALRGVVRVQALITPALRPVSPTAILCTVLSSRASKHSLSICDVRALQGIAYEDKPQPRSPAAREAGRKPAEREPPRVRGARQRPSTAHLAPEVWEDLPHWPLSPRAEGSRPAEPTPAGLMVQGRPG
ncbi:Phospholipid-Transporting Atpase Ib [Manis pentadactyla]|nr:Phospholipid-Transporting Atpase Ib [Manis pentadactyla]